MMLRRLSGGCSRNWRRSKASRLYMQPVQDLTVEDRVSRTQFQYSIEDADAQELAQWTPKLVAKLQTLPELRDVATDQLNNGLKTNITIDRDTASRLGIFPQAIDNTLYDAFGQRQVSTIFTQLNQYHVVLEVLPNFAQTPENLRDIYIRPSTVTPNTGAPTANGAAVTHQRGAGSDLDVHAHEFDATRRWR